MKGIHKTTKLTTGNVELQRAQFQQAKSKKSSLARAAENTLKFKDLVEDSRRKIPGKPEDKKGPKREPDPGKIQRTIFEEDEEDGPTPPYSTGFDIRI